MSPVTQNESEKLSKEMETSNLFVRSTLRYLLLPHDISYALVVSAVMNHPGKMQGHYYDSIMTALSKRELRNSPDLLKMNLKTAIHAETMNALSLQILLENK